MLTKERSIGSPERVVGTVDQEDHALDRVWVIIPVFNEEASLPLVLGDLPEVGRVIVVDNGSTDGSAKLALQYGATVVTEPRRGYGSACLAGLRAVRELTRENSRPDVIVFVDGDYSDHPNLLPDLVTPLMEKQADLVIGSRMLGEREPGAMPPAAIFGNWLAPFLMWFFWGAKFTDLGPFRAITWQALEQLNMSDQNFGWTVEMQIKATLIRLRCKEIAVPYRCRVGHSKISGTISGTFKAAFKILYTIARYRCLTWWHK